MLRLIVLLASRPFAKKIRDIFLTGISKQNKATSSHDASRAVLEQAQQHLQGVGAAGSRRRGGRRRSGREAGVEGGGGGGFGVGVGIGVVVVEV